MIKQWIEQFIDKRIKHYYQPIQNRQASINGTMLDEIDSLTVAMDSLKKKLKKTTGRQDVTGRKENKAATKG